MEEFRTGEGGEDGKNVFVGLPWLGNYSCFKWNGKRAGILLEGAELESNVK